MQTAKFREICTVFGLLNNTNDEEFICKCFTATLLNKFILS